MLSLTRQERQVLVILAAIFLCGVSLHYATKIFPRLWSLVNLLESDMLYPKTDINRAGAGELVRIPMIGPATAGRILEYRRDHGPFARIEELKKVKGIDREKYKTVARYIEIGGGR